MSILFSEDSLKGAKLFLGILMHNRVCTTKCLVGLLDLISLCIQHKLPLILHATSQEDVMTKGKNDCVATFLDSDFTHLLFVDANIGFSAEDVFSMLSTMVANKEKYSVLAGLYPKKRISWEKIASAVEKGIGNSDPVCLKKYGVDYDFLACPDKSFTMQEPVQVLEVGAGFMMISRRTFECFIEFYQDKFHRVNGEKRYVFFATGISQNTKMHLTEDAMFCQYVREMGKEVWIAPWLQLTYEGIYTYKGSLSHLIKIGMSYLV